MSSNTTVNQMRKIPLSFIAGGFLLTAAVFLSLSAGITSCNPKDDCPQDTLTNEGNGVYTDIRDGNTYPYTTIGQQIWMTKNLAYLPSVQPPSVYSNTEKYYYVGDYQGIDMAEAKATSNYKTYGVLYNWPAAMDGSATSDQVPSGVKGVCPPGWHLPSDEEWKILERNLGMAQGADATSLREYGEVGKKLKSTTGWHEGANGDNSSGFSALPGGHIFYDHNFRYIGLHAIFWTATDYADLDDSDAWFRDLSKGIGVVRDASMYFQGLSVRCLKD